ncbi:MAG: Cys-tRNA(Pro) deacylase [Desulfobacula sp.]|jgi:Cys-tRNA(Pro)/Cys-tRNA(Cys) deacylase|uniref:Cys-tRNA(Pro) deacylase n=1 Tax=Desulfobacula sp. TaxID=2593537 RepID=UPI001D4756E6|nr:Cys-tRNA(Pro) deacylase [Desulfobacula sp.]MBT3486753.1 Cys-tRNA(Pro) deacylase [Desulfobacula sp.]MBT3806373.1 Cys-tRNA(Pro) deacylase [Desulfobacula sp.]MBT4023989.1 Cys-tRNA(Pro) deacylase [Desulfobacula sp.]MBT4198351.1 Cys-tRNA(Pro) deacylase [Desulfobacula sp.]
MTPAINCLKKAKIKYRIHRYDHDPVSRAYGEEAAEKLNIPFDQIFKTLVVSVENKDLFIAVVPVSKQLDLKKFVKAIGSKKAKMADKNDVERTTGYILGGVSPIGQKKQLTTIIDSSALNFDTVYVSAGRRGLQIAISPQDLGSQTGAKNFKISK